MTDRPRRHQNGRTNGASGIIRWHRRIGVTLAVILLAVGVTGVALNHAEDFDLREIRIEAPWLYRWYGMQPRSEPVAVRWQERWVVWLDDSLYLDARLAARVAGIQGAVGLDATLVAAGPRELVLLTPEGEIVERLGEASLPPGRIVRVGRTGGADPHLVVQTESNRTFVFDRDLVRWTEGEEGAMAVDWSSPETPPPEQRERVLAAYRGEGLTLHRVLVDLHSGRFFGRAGVWVVDAAAIGLLFLTFSGLYSVFRGGRKSP